MPRLALGLRFWRPVGFAFLLALLVAVAATGGLTWLALAMIGSTLLAFGGFCLSFPHGMQAALALATMQAAYMALFVFFLEANFPRVEAWQSALGYVMPVAAFLAGTFVKRAEIGAVLVSERLRGARFDHLLGWALPLGLVGAASFLLVDLDLSPRAEEMAFLAAMALIALVVGLAARDVVVFVLDTGILFEGVFARARHLVQPAFAFLVFWALLAIVFATLYRIIDLATLEPQFRVAGQLRHIAFAESLYFSVVTLATVGYGDMAPVAPLARVLAVVQMLAGLMLLLFGFHEIIRAVDERGHRGRPDHAEHHPARHPDRPGHGPH